MQHIGNAFNLIIYCLGILSLGLIVWLVIFVRKTKKHGLRVGVEALEPYLESLVSACPQYSTLTMTTNNPLELVQAMKTRDENGQDMLIMNFPTDRIQSQVLANITSLLQDRGYKFEYGTLDHESFATSHLVAILGVDIAKAAAVMHEVLQLAFKLRTDEKFWLKLDKAEAET